MNNFGLFDFISKLSSSKEAQTSLINLISGLVKTNRNSTTAQTDNKSSENENSKSKNNNNNSVDLKSDVYRSPDSYTIYNEMIENHIRISKEIDCKNHKNS